MRIFSGIRPTGRLHIGNYLGAVKSWLELQEKGPSIFAVVDYHGITTPFDSKKIGKETYDVVLDYLAAGVNPKKSLIIIQSHISEHTELAWILSSITPLSWFERVPTYKEKIALHPEYVSLGLLAYPALMAADILLYKTTHVPVGRDQVPHVELTNSIARRFNMIFGAKTFSSVRVILNKGAKIMSLQNPLKKMSKTGDEGIGLSDSPAEIRKKIKAAVTDSGREIKMAEDKPAISNLLTIYSLFSGKSIIASQEQCKGRGYAEFKKDLAEVTIKALEPFRKKRKELQKNPNYVKKVLTASEKKAQKIAQETLREVKKKIGLLG